MPLTERFRRIVSLGFKPSPSGIIKQEEKPNTEPEDSLVARTLLWMIREKANTIGVNIRQHGKQLYGTMWKEIHVILPDGRKVWLQQSQDQSDQPEMLEVNVYSANEHSKHIRFSYDLRNGSINAYEVWNMRYRFRKKDKTTLIRTEIGSRPIIVFPVSDEPQYGISANLLLQDMAKPPKHFTLEEMAKLPKTPTLEEIVEPLNKLLTDIEASFRILHPQPEPFSLPQAA